MNCFSEIEIALEALQKEKSLTSEMVELLRESLPDNYSEADILLDYYIAKLERKEERDRTSNAIIYGIAYPGLTFFLSVLIALVAAFNPSNLVLVSIVGGIVSIVMIIISLLLVRKVEKVSVIDELYEIKRDYLRNHIDEHTKEKG